MSLTSLLMLSPLSATGTRGGTTTPAMVRSRESDADADGVGPGHVSRLPIAPAADAVDALTS
jgi:hypothetical protein